MTARMGFAGRAGGGCRSGGRGELGDRLRLRESAIAVRVDPRPTSCCVNLIRLDQIISFFPVLLKAKRVANHHRCGGVDYITFNKEGRDGLS